tara:strand:+ start:1305 stop:1589 length:285 start_codon:yes stop_codon:yes gene_type:complete
MRFEHSAPEVAKAHSQKESLQNVRTNQGSAQIDPDTRPMEQPNKEAEAQNFLQRYMKNPDFQKKVDDFEIAFKNGGSRAALDFQPPTMDEGEVV